MFEDLENGMSNKDVSEKYDVPKNLSAWRKNKGNILSDLQKSGTNSKQKKMSSSGYKDVDNGSLQKTVKMYPLIGFY